jgi:N-methylhydantoinase A
MSYIIGIDIGGTFTDAVATDEGGILTGAKTPSTPPDFAQGVCEVLEELAASLGLTREELLRQTTYISHGTTAALNALITGDVAKVGFLTTRGHADSLVIMNLAGRYAGLGPEQIQAIAKTNKPAPLVPKALVREINERIDYKGTEIFPLDEKQAKIAIRELLHAGVEAIAIALLWSFRNPKHELCLRDLIHSENPSIYVGLSSEISPRIREYPRSATTVMSTMVGPRLQAYLDPLQERLRTMGFQGSLLVMQGTGQTVLARDAAKKAITTVGSVLTGGAIGAVTLASQLGHTHVISTDMGGTTFLVGLIVDGKPRRSTTTILNQHTINVPMVEVAAIGSGGGAIAWVDAGRTLRVGPRSGGGGPGPACYGDGGTEPTITDANLVLGIMNPAYFLGGRKSLYPELAKSAIKTNVADKLGMTVDEAALAIRAIQDAQTSDLIRKVVVHSGADPRDFVVYAFGGAGPTHCATNTADLGVKSVVVPLGPTAAAFSAFGLVSADAGMSAELSFPSNYPVPATAINEMFSGLEKSVRDSLDAQGIEFTRVTIQREIDIRYSLQLAEVCTPVKNGELSDNDVAEIAADFEDQYERLFGKGTGFKDAGFQFMTYRVFATGHFPSKPQLPTLPAAESETPPVSSMRRARLDGMAGWTDTAVYDYKSLRAGHRIAAPAIIEAPTTTVAVPAGHDAIVDSLGNLVITKKGERGC